MKFTAPALLAMIFLLPGCKSNRGTTECATELQYVTNRFTVGAEALRHASEYRAKLAVGAPDVIVEAIVDTGSANFAIDEKNFEYDSETRKSNRPYIFNNGHDKAIAFNAKDSLDVACFGDFSTRFLLLSGKQDSLNYLGLAYNDPLHRPHEKKSAPFFDQLVIKGGLKNEFSLALCGHRGNSRVLLGGIDKRMKNLVHNFVPIIEKTSYVVPALNLRRADNKLVLGEFPNYDVKNRSGIRTIIDSGSSFLVLPPKMAKSISDEIQKEAEYLGLNHSFPEGFFRTERFNSTKVVHFASLDQLRQFPALEITFTGVDGQKKNLELSPLHYFKEMDNYDPLTRTFAIRESSGDAILGQPFLENHYTYFDRKNGQIGFGNIDLACANQ